MTYAARPNFEQSLEFSLWTLAVLAILLAGLWAAVLIRTWCRGREDRAEGAHQMLIQIGDLRREGDLTDDEFRSIKGRLIQQIDSATREQSIDGEEKFSD